MLVILRQDFFAYMNPQAVIVKSILTSDSGRAVTEARGKGTSWDVIRFYLRLDSAIDYTLGERCQGCVCERPLVHCVLA